MAKLSVDEMVNHRVWNKMREQGNESDTQNLTLDNLFDINSYVNTALSEDVLEDDYQLGDLFSEAIEKVMTQWD